MLNEKEKQQITAEEIADRINIIIKGIKKLEIFFIFFIFIIVYKTK